MLTLERLRGIDPENFKQAFTCLNQAISPGSHLRRKCKPKRKFKRKKRHVWISLMQMQTQKQVLTQEMENFYFLALAFSIRPPAKIKLFFFYGHAF